MKYTIYKLIKPEHLQKSVPGGYGYKTLERVILEELDDSHIESEHATMEGAIAEIVRNSERLEFTNLAIIPVIYVGQNGEIRD